MAASGPALAAGQPTSASPSSGVLVRGGAPLPQFYLDFPNIPASPADAAPAIDRDLEISVTSPDQSVLRFLFSPRPQITSSLDQGTGASRSFAGLSWNLFDSGGIFGNLGFGGSVTRFGLAGDDFDRHLFGPPLALHSTLELGYQFGSQNSLSLSLDHSSTPDFYNDRAEINNFQIRYGLRF